MLCTRVQGERTISFPISKQWEEKRFLPRLPGAKAWRIVDQSYILAQDVDFLKFYFFLFLKNNFKFTFLLGNVHLWGKTQRIWTAVLSRGGASSPPPLPMRVLLPAGNSCNRECLQPSKEMDVDAHIGTHTHLFCFT